jgi:hypothetical protein
MEKQLMIRSSGLILLLSGALLGGCATTAEMDIYVPARCHGIAESFQTYRLAFVDVPGFIEPVIRTSLEGALAAQGLDAADDADIRVISTFYLIDRNPPPPEYADPFGEPVQTGEVNRFVTHLEVDVVDQRTDALLWTGAMFRSHAIEGGETFHDERAVLIIRQAFDDMFVGLTIPCE